MEQLARVLLIDDDAVLLQALAITIGMRLDGVTGDSTLSALDGLRRLREVDYHAAVVDVLVPRMDGIAFLKEVTRLSPLLHVILISGHPEAEQKAQGGGAFSGLQAH